MGSGTNWPLYVDKEDFTPQFGRFCIQPLERGVGSVLADSLRRALLESLPGAAVSAMRFRLFRDHGADSVRESALLTQLTKWLQEVRVTSAAQFPLAASVRKRGPFWISGSELKFIAPARVISTDTTPVELRSGETLELDLLFNWGKGEVPAEKVRDESLPRGWVPLSRSHSPVRKVRLTTASIEIGQHRGHEQVIAEIMTDGSISPEDALRRASSHAILPPRPLAG